MQKRAFLISLVLSLTLAIATNAWAASEKVLYSFTGGSDGGFPSSSLVMDAAGNLYGTTAAGGTKGDCSSDRIPGCGVVFKLTSVNGSWQESVLYAFQGGPDGAYPRGNLVFDASGNLYGTTYYGGTGTCSTEGCGTAFELSPNQNGSWIKTTLYSFQNQPDGAFPDGLTFDSSNNLYGVATAGGTNGRGAAYELSPPQQQGNPWTEKIIYNFQDFETQPNPVLVFDSQGNLYGTYFQLYACFPTTGCGAVFQLKNTGGTWTLTDLFDFTGGGNGGEPMAGVILDSQGNLYGTGAQGGNNWGMVFELKPRANGGQYEGMMLHNFCSINNCADGMTPDAALVMDSSGALYGTTSSGGRPCRTCGLVFKLVHTKYGWDGSVLYNFRDSTDGGSPTQSLILDAQGNLYGTTTAYGSDGHGTVYEVTQ
jgi:hypothetical protein